MGSKRLSSLTTGAALDTGDDFYGVQGGNSRKFTGAQIATLVAPFTTRGDMLYRDASGNARLSVGAADTFMGSDGTDPSWRTAAQVRASLTQALDKLDATTSPTVNDDSGDGYGVGSLWFDVTHDIMWSCLDASVGAAVWQAHPRVGGSNFGYVSGNYYYGGVGTFGTNTFTAAANQLYAVPIDVAFSVTLAAICIEVTTLAAGNVRMGVYRNSGAYPSTLVVDAGTADTGTTGFKEIVTTQVLTPGKYWLASVFDATPTLRRLSGLANPSSIQLGANQEADSVGDVRGRVIVAHTYGALPDPFTGSGTYSDISNAPRTGFLV